MTSAATTALTNKECSPYGAHWTFDAYALSAGTARAVVAEGGRTWLFVRRTGDRANSGADTANAVKQAFEFGLGKDHALAAFLPFISDIRAIGLTIAQGLTLTTAFYWDRTTNGGLGRNDSSPFATPCPR